MGGVGGVPACVCVYICVCACVCVCMCVRERDRQIETEKERDSNQAKPNQTKNPTNLKILYLLLTDSITHSLACCCTGYTGADLIVVAQTWQDGCLTINNDQDVDTSRLTGSGAGQPAVLRVQVPSGQEGHVSSSCGAISGYIYGLANYQAWSMSIGWVKVRIRSSWLDCT